MSLVYFCFCWPCKEEEYRDRKWRNWFKRKYEGLGQKRFKWNMTLSSIHVAEPGWLTWQRPMVSCARAAKAPKGLSSWLNTLDFWDCQKYFIGALFKRDKGLGVFKLMWPYMCPKAILFLTSEAHLYFIATITIPYTK